MRKKIICLIVLVVVIIILINFIYLNPFIYNNNYWTDIGIKDAHTYDYVIKQLGQPNEIISNDEFSFVCYNNLKLMYEKELHGTFISAWVTSEKYKFGIRHIGVGSSKKEVQEAYGKNIQKITELPSDQIGYVDGDFWIFYYLDKDDMVYQIVVSNGP